MDKRICAEGFSAPSGEEWIRVSVGQRHGWVPRREFHGAGKEAIDRLRLQNVIIIGSSRIKELLNFVAELSHFPPRELIENVGWNGPHFALPDGTVFSPKSSTGEVLFDRIHRRCAEKGTIKEWKIGVAEPLADQTIATFILSMAFAAPILKLTNRVGNLGFELVGPKGTGKSTIQQIMASVLGGAIQGEDGHYWTSFDATPSGLEQAMASHSDLPMILEEANLYIADQSPRARGDHFKALAFRLAGGSEKARFGYSKAREFRFVYLTSSNEPLAALIGRNSETVRAAADRLITIPIPDHRPHGLFDSIPERFNSGSEFAKYLIAAADQNHGLAIRRFLIRLVKARARDETKLKSEIATMIAMFCRKAKVDPANGSAIRVAQAFGIVYAAGELAKKFGALPEGMQCGPAALACYRLHLSKDDDLESFATLLSAIAKRDDVINLGKSKILDVDSIDIASAPAFIRERGANRELWIRRPALNKLIPHWDSLKRNPDIDARLARDGHHKTVKRPVGPNGAQERVYCFALPDVK